jgi:hypothetical protein
VACHNSSLNFDDPKLTQSAAHDSGMSYAVNAVLLVLLVAVALGVAMFVGYEVARLIAG